MQMRMEDFLPGHCFTIPSQVVPVGSMLFIKEFFDLLKEMIGSLPFILIQVECGPAVALGNYQSRTDKNWFFLL